MLTPKNSQALLSGFQALMDSISRIAHFLPRLWRKPLTAFFVEESNNKSKSDRNPERLDLELISIGKRTGLSFEEMNEFRVRDLLAYARVFTGAGKEDDKPRKASQKDINTFYSS